MSLLTTLQKQFVFLRFAIREWWPLWFNVLNAEGRAAYKKDKIALSPVQRRILTDLNTEGIALSSLDELFPGEDMFSQLKKYAVELEPSLSANVAKEYLVNYWELVPTFDIRNPFLALSLNRTLFDIAKSYMQMWVRLKYYHLAKTLPVGGAEAIQSQNWHRDPEEKRMLKVFVYLNEVDADAGPFTYISQSVYGLPYGSVAPQKPPEGSYPEASIIEHHIPKENIQAYTGNAGTVLFCDTSGLHRGGYAKSKERLMFTVSYNAATFSEPSRYRFDTDRETTIASLPEDQQYALSGKLWK